MKIREVLTKSLLALEASGVFFTPLARRVMGERWSEYHDDALHRRTEAMDLVRDALVALPSEPSCCSGGGAKPAPSHDLPAKKKAPPAPSEYPYRDAYTDGLWRELSVQKRGAITKDFRRRLGLCIVCVKNPVIRAKAERDYALGWRPQPIQPAQVIFRCGCGEIFGLDD
jgi:hypothetical protein